MAKYKRYLRCGEGCVYFNIPNKKEKWGYCLVKKEQRSKYQSICKNFTRRE